MDVFFVTSFGPKCGLHRVRRFYPRGWFELRVRRGPYLYRLVHRPYVGLIHDAWAYDPPYASFLCPHWVEVGETWMKQVQLSKGLEVPATLASTSSGLLSACPLLIAHCAALRFDDGTPRRPGWLTITTQSSSWKASVKCPNAGASFSVLAPSVDDMLGMVELLLETDAAPWERDEWLQKNSKKK